MRTILFADVHGNLNVLENIVKASKMEEADRVIFLGDFCDRGPKSVACLNRIEELRAEFIMGNHELAHMINTPLGRKHYDYSLDDDGTTQRMRDIFLAGNMPIATNVDDILITHAGLSILYANSLGISLEMTIDDIVRELNKCGKDLVTYDGYSGLYSYDDRNEIATNPFSVMWWRPWTEAAEYLRGESKEAAELPYPVRQIFGHSAKEWYNKQQKKILVEVNAHTIDVAAPRHYTDSFYRYAEVIDGEIFIREGYLDD